MTSPSSTQNPSPPLPTPLSFLKSPHPLSSSPPTLHRLPTAFAKLRPTSPDDPHRYAAIISSLFTRSECAQLLSAAESTTDPKSLWSPALVNTGNGTQALFPDTRNCGRIIWDSAEVAAWIWGRVAPFVDADIMTLTGRPDVTGWGPVRRKETWRAKRLNERLRFLRYERGQFFREHCDGSYVTEDGREVSFVTVHVYLNGGEGEDLLKEGEERLEGGETRFMSEDGKTKLDVNPEVGSVLVFQHRGLWHAGEEVRKGLKFTLRTDVMYEKVEEGE